ncbi:MAG TPA: TetR/AcrR family transcriptional regulator [Terracidiphilus sp.]
MARKTASRSEPRKTPVQARSNVSVDAILKATVQVLLGVGKEKLTTTRVAARAGVSVGTLYQYFPNKSALLRAALRLHVEEIVAEVDKVCIVQRGQPVEQMAEALAVAFLAVKMRDPKKSRALYAVSSDVEGAKISAGAVARANHAIVGLLQSAPEGLATDLQLMATVLQSTIAGVKRQLLESDTPEAQFEVMQRQLVLVVRSYVRACVGR